MGQFQKRGQCITPYHRWREKEGLCLGGGGQREIKNVAAVGSVGPRGRDLVSGTFPRVSLRRDGKTLFIGNQNLR